MGIPAGNVPDSVCVSFRVSPPDRADGGFHDSLPKPRFVPKRIGVSFFSRTSNVLANPFLEFPSSFLYFATLFNYLTEAPEESSMQRSLFFMLLFLACPVVSQQKKALTADQIYRNAEPKVLTSLPNIVRWLDDSHYLEMKTKEGESRPVAYSVDAKTGKETEYKGLEQYKDIVGSDITVTSPASANEENTRLIYVKDNDLYYLNTEKKEFKRLTRTPAEEKNPTLSPDANSVAFTRDNNLFALDLSSGKEMQYTNDGSEVVYSGWASWVYYEEILGRPSRYRAFWWSPDGKKIIFYRFDDSKVPMFPIYSSEGQHGNLERTRYPKSGDTNPEVRIGIVSVATGTIVWADFNEKQDQYFGQPFWMPDSRQVFVQWMNRGQDTLLIYSIF